MGKNDSTCDVGTRAWLLAHEGSDGVAFTMTGSHPHEPTPSLPSPPAQEPEGDSGRFPWRYAGVLFALAFLGALLKIPYEIEPWWLYVDPEAVLAWRPTELSLELAGEKGVMISGPPDVIVDATISLVAILVGLRLGPPLGLAWLPLAGSGSGPAPFGWDPRCSCRRPSA